MLSTSSSYTAERARFNETFAQNIKGSRQRQGLSEAILAYKVSSEQSGLKDRRGGGRPQMTQRLKACLAEDLCIVYPFPRQCTHESVYN